MNKLFFAIAISMTTAVGFSQAQQDPVRGGPQPSKQRQQLTPEERTERARARRERHLKKVAEAGGMVVRDAKGKYIRIFDAQSQVSDGLFDKVVKSINEVVGMPTTKIKMDPAKTPLETVAKAMKTEKTGAAIIVLESDALPAILVAPEKSWAIVNVTALTEDLPPKNLLETRTHKEIFRAAAWALGAGEYTQSMCLMGYEPTLEKLDANSMMVPSPDPMSRMMNGSAIRGISPLRRTTYQKACEEGWAPPPTNDIQKAIWDKVHELPTNPLPLVKPAK